MTPERRKKLEQVLHYRQPDLAIVLEEVQDQHNIYATLRSADAVGVQDVYVIHQGKSLKWREGKDTSATAYKWVNLHTFASIAECMEQVRSTYDSVLGTHLGQEAMSLYDLDLTTSVALVFGNERSGISPEMMEYVDENFLVPMMGMVPSLNISVACAITLFEALRQRMNHGHYDQPKLSDAEMETLIRKWQKK